MALKHFGDVGHGAILFLGLVVGSDSPRCCAAGASPSGPLPPHVPIVSLLTVLLRLGFRVRDLGTEKLNSSVTVFMLVAWWVSAGTPRRELAPSVPLSAFPGSGCAALPLLPAGAACAGVGAVSSLKEGFSLQSEQWGLTTADLSCE